MPNPVRMPAESTVEGQTRNGIIAMLLSREQSDYSGPGNRPSSFKVSHFSTLEEDKKEHGKAVVSIVVKPNHMCTSSCLHNIRDVQNISNRACT